MGSVRKRRRPPGSDRLRILRRYAAGDTLAEIAGNYGCSVRLIRTILERQARHPRPIANGSGRISSMKPLDTALRSRISEAMVRFLIVLDAALARATGKNLGELHESADQLMRAVARVRLELGGGGLNGVRVRPAGARQIVASNGNRLKPLKK